MTEQNNDIEALVPTPKTVKLGEREVTIGPMNMGQILKVGKVFEGGKLAAIPANADLLTLIDAFPEEMIQVAMIVCDAKREEIDGLEVIDFVNLCADIIEGNRDFFARRIGPAMQRLLGELIRVATMVGAGSTPSSR